MVFALNHAVFRVDILRDVTNEREEFPDAPVDHRYSGEEIHDGMGDGGNVLYDTLSIVDPKRYCFDLRLRT